MDLFGPLKTRSASGNKLILVITNAFTKYTELVPLHNKEVSFERWICRFGVPTAIVSDRGKEFMNAVMQDLTKWLGANHNKTSPYHPQTNASAKWYNCTMKAYLTAMLGNNQTLDWEECCQHSCSAITPRSTSQPWSPRSSSRTSTTRSSRFLT